MFIQSPLNAYTSYDKVCILKLFHKLMVVPSFYAAGWLLLIFDIHTLLFVMFPPLDQWLRDQVAMPLMCIKYIK